MSRIRADKLVNRAGSGTPQFPYGAQDAIGIQSGGVSVGTGVTALNFVGTGNSIRLNGGTVEISISGSSGSGGSGATGAGMSATGINTGGFFSNPNSVDAAISLTNPDHNYGMFGPVALNATVTVGAGNTFTVV